MAPGLARTLVRLFGDYIRSADAGNLRAVAIPRRRGGSWNIAAVCRREISNRRRAGAAGVRRVAALPGTARSQLSAGAQYGQDGGALAHAHQDARSAHFGAALA